jgi:hypothetical protein
VSLIIDHISESALARLRDLARLQRRSEQELAGDILERALRGRFTRKKAAARIQAMTPVGVRQTDSVELLRQIRDE